MGRFLVAVLAIVAMGCGGAGLTKPDEPVPHFIIEPSNSDQLALAESWWARQAACVGVNPAVAYRVRIEVVPDAFTCANVLAAGCMRYSRITVWGRYFEEALSHELIHFALWKKGENIGHDNPAFARCDTLNWVGSAKISVD